MVIPAPSVCPCCQGKLVKLGEDVTETLEVIPRQWKVIQTIREKFTCRSCERIAQPPAPFHPIARGRAGAGLLAMVLFGKYGLHLPLNRQSEGFAREGIELDVSTLADWVGACAAACRRVELSLPVDCARPRRRHHVAVLAKGKTSRRLWTYVRDDRRSAAVPAAASTPTPGPRRRTPRAGTSPRRRILQDAIGFNASRSVAQAGADHERRAGHTAAQVFVLADVARPLALEAVRRIDAISRSSCEINALASIVSSPKQRSRPLVAALSWSGPGAKLPPNATPRIDYMLSAGSPSYAYADGRSATPIIRRACAARHSRRPKKQIGCSPDRRGGEGPPLLPLSPPPIQRHRPASLLETSSAASPPSPAAPRTAP